MNQIGEYGDDMDDDDEPPQLKFEIDSTFPRENLPKIFKHLQ